MVTLLCEALFNILKMRERSFSMSEQAETREESEQKEEPPLSGSLNVAGEAGARASLWRTTWALLGDSWKALKLIVVLLVLCGVVFPLIVFVIGQLVFPDQANGSLLRDKQDLVIGSKLLGQQFTRAEYFHGRPSAAGYNASNSTGSNIGPTNPQLIGGNGSEVTVAAGTPPPTNATPVPGKANTYSVPGSYAGVKAYAEQFRQENGLPPNTPLPADIITASGSGLDPDISIDAALLQVNRIVAARQKLGGTNATITPDKVRELIRQNTQGRDLGFLGEPRVNVLALNVALNEAYGAPPAH